MTRVIFLDRDGVLNVDYGYIFKSSDFRIIDGVFDALRFFSDLGFLLIIVTNQSGIRRGLYSEKDFLELNDYMLDLFKNNFINITDVFYCPHGPLDNCSCRKPKTGMIDIAVSRYAIDRKKSYMIGDKVTDVEAGRSAGLAKSFLINNRETEESNGSEYYSFKNLLEIAEKWRQIQ